MEYNSFMEALKGKQKKLDKNHNGEIDSQDLKIVRNEETESLDEASTTTTQRTDTNRPTYDVHSKATGNHIGTIYTPSKTNPKHQTTVYDSTGKIHKKSEHDTLKDAHDFIKTSRGIKEEAEELDEIRRMKTKLNKLDAVSNMSVARQKLSNLMKSGKAKGALIANKRRTLNMGDDIDQEDLDALNEVLSKDAKAGDWIHDFVHSDNPKFDGKSKKERIKMALGAYYDTNKKKDGVSEGYQSYSGPSHGHPYGGSGFGRREREDDEYHNEPQHRPMYQANNPTNRPQHPVAPVPDKKYIKGTPENKAHKAANKPINGHPTNEEVEQIEEKSEQAKQNKTMKNMMDASRGARYKLNNPVPDADPEHKTAQAHNKAIGRGESKRQ